MSTSCATFGTILKPGDALLLGTDLEKPVPQLIDAYDDPLGVTAAFNLNLLARINRELEGDFDLSQFEHVARFNSETRSVEMHLRSKRQADRRPSGGADLTVAFEEGETIWTENSHKYSLEEVARMAGDGGIRLRRAVDRPGMAVRGEPAGWWLGTWNNAAMPLVEFRNVSYDIAGKRILSKSNLAWRPARLWCCWAAAGPAKARR